MTWVKICGTTSLEDALLAAEAGADALGFIFAESPRRIEPELARQTIKKLPVEIEKVGVFVNASLRSIGEVAEKTGITRIQLQGEEDAAFLRKLRESLPRLKVTKVLRVDERLVEFIAAISGLDLADSIMLDSGSPSRPGGTGKPFDWAAAKQSVAKATGGSAVHWIVAGGLTPENVGDAIRLLRPWGVDVVTGVESAPGKKDAIKVEKFISAVRRLEVPLQIELKN